jgi:tetratricopeptide (TPR) repeat protein
MHEPADPSPPLHQAGGDPARRPSHSGITPWLVVLVAVGLVFGPLWGGLAPRERARWRIAAGLEYWLDQDLTSALDALDAAAKLAPEYARIYELRAEWRIFAGDYQGALEDARQLRRLAPGELDGFRLEADALLYLGRGQEAVATWVEYAKLEKDRDGSIQPATLNGVAYFRALANTDLDAALKEVNEAIDLAGPDPAMIDTRGYIRFRQKKYIAALADLNPSVIAVERELEKSLVQERQNAALGAADPRAVAWQMKLLRRNVAVIRYHRGQILQAIGRAADAEKDFRRVRELGFEPGARLF